MESNNWNQNQGQQNGPQYGGPGPDPFRNNPFPTQYADSLAGTSKALGIVAIVFLFFCPVVSLVCGLIAMSKANQSRRLTNGIRTSDGATGYALGLASVIISLLPLIVIFFALASALIIPLLAG